MEFYDEKDLAYWRRQSVMGKALIIEIPVRMLLDPDFSFGGREGAVVSKIDDLQEWIDENRMEIEKALEEERREKAEVEKLAGRLYVKEGTVGDDGPKDAEKTAADNAGASGTVASIMAKDVFSEEQIAVIGEAMTEGLPDKYLLCFLRKEYTPAVMRQLKDYVTKLWHEEGGAHDGKS